MRGADPILLDQALRLSGLREIWDSPLVRLTIVRDPAYVPMLVPFLEANGERSANARLMLHLFGPAAVLPLLTALQGAAENVIVSGLTAVSAMLLDESALVINDVLKQSSSAIGALLEDKRWIPNTLPSYVERDFQGRICDLAYILLNELADRDFDQSVFRSLDSDGRDREIATRPEVTMRPPPSPSIT